MHRALLIALLLAAAGCGSANFTGNYTVAITNADNGCSVPNWQVGSTASGIPFTITQTGTQVMGTVGGLSGTYLLLVIGADTFVGSGSGSQITMTLAGTHPYSQGTCAYTINATVQGQINGDAISGNVVYTAATNNSPSCGALTTCQSLQSFVGARPPQ